jgi:ATPase subunit of ABC transporter with duplicated ATPase domains
MESAAQKNLSTSLTGELDCMKTEYNESLRQSQEGDTSAASRAIDLQSQIAQIRSLIKESDQASVTAEVREYEEKAQQEEKQYKKFIDEKQAKESDESKDSALMFLNDDSNDHKDKLPAVSTQVANLSSSQLAGKTNTYETTEEKTTDKPVSSSGQTST